MDLQNANGHPAPDASPSAAPQGAPSTALVPAASTAVAPSGPVKPAGKIDRPGRYILSMDEYHGQPCIGPSVSSSGIRQFDSESAAHFFANWSGNPDREPPGDTAAFAVGRAAHVLALGEGAFEKQFVISPYDEFRTNESKAWRAAQQAEGFTVLKRAEAEQIAAMANALTSNPLYRKAMHDGVGEVSYIWQDPVTGIWLKARPDWTPLGAMRPLYDLKTTVSAAPAAINKSVFEYGYHVQAALALMGVEAVMGEQRPGFCLLFLEKTAPYSVTFAAFDEADILFGRQIIRKTLDAMARCIETGRWPHYTDTPVMIQRPRWLEEKAGELFAEYGAV